MKTATRIRCVCLLGTTGGCAYFTSEGARDRYLTEVARHLGTDTLDAEASLRRERSGDRNELTLPDCLRLALASSDRRRPFGERMLQADLVKARAIAGVLPQVPLHGRFTRDSALVEFGAQAFTPQERTEILVLGQSDAARQSPASGTRPRREDAAHRVALASGSARSDSLRRGPRLLRDQKPGEGHRSPDRVQDAFG